MTITFKDVLKLAKGAHSLPALRSVVFDGKSAMTAAQLDWMVGVPCLQPTLTAPVVVPVEALQAHLLKSRHLVVMPDHLSNGQGLVTPFNKKPRVDYDSVLDMLPKQPEGEAVSFELELDALDRVLIAAGERDIRYYLNGVLFDLTEGMLVGTDGHRLHAYKNRVPRAYPREVVDGMPMGEVVQVVLPRDPLKWMTHSASVGAKLTIWNAKAPKADGVETLPKVLPQVLLQTEDGFVWIRKPLEGRFPDYSRVIPAVVSRPVWAQVDAVKMADTVAAMGNVVALATEGKSRAVNLDFGRGKVFGRDETEVLALPVVLNSDRVDIDLQGLEQELWMGVMANYVQDVADCVTAEAQWRLSHTNQRNEGLMVVDGDFTGVVMGLRNFEPVGTVRKPKKTAKPVEVAQADPVGQEGPDEPEESPPEPCPAAVDAMAAQLVAQVVGKAQEAAQKAQKAPKARKTRKLAKSEPVAA